MAIDEGQQWSGRWGATGSLEAPRDLCTSRMNDNPSNRSSSTLCHGNIYIAHLRTRTSPARTQPKQEQPHHITTPSIHPCDPRTTTKIVLWLARGEWDNGLCRLSLLLVVLRNRVDDTSEETSAYGAYAAESDRVAKEDHAGCGNRELVQRADHTVANDQCEGREQELVVMTYE